MAEHGEQGRPGPAGLGGEQLDLIVRRIEYLPTLPAVAAGLVELAAEDRDASAAMLDLARLDPALTAGMLARANRGGGDARTVDQAAERIGLDAARSVLLAAPALPCPPSESFKVGRRAATDPDASGPAAMGHREFWRHCIAVGSAVQMLAPEAQLSIAPGEAFVCGLLHDIGKLALQRCFPKSYSRVLAAVETRAGDIADHERGIIGVDHCAFARRLCEHWRLPAAVREVAWLHSQPPEAIPPRSPYRQLIALAGLADTIARREAIGFSGNQAFIGSLAEQSEGLGICDAAVREVIERLGRAVPRRVAALGLGRQDRRPPALHDSLAGANAELARINERLQRRSDALRRRAEAFENLAAFTSSLTPEASVADVLVAVARLTAAGVDHAATAAAPVVAYSPDDVEGVVLAACFRGGDNVDWRRMEAGPAAGAHGDGPAAGRADDALADLLADPYEIGDWLDPVGYEHRPLACGGRWIGGVLFPARRPDPAGAEAADEVLDALIAGMTLALAMVLSRTRATAISDGLAGASQALAAAQSASAEARAFAAVGEMAAGAAHEINNPLAVISGRAQLNAKRAKDEEDRRMWSLIAEKAQQISDIATALMEFARPRSPSATALSAAELLRQAAEAFRRSDHPKAAAARVDITIGEDLPEVMADEAQMRAVIAELMTNAANAAAGDPVIRLGAEACEDQDAVLFSVADNGRGMDPETVAGAFTPFFSAQQAGRRRGLGLPRARRYVENNGGRIWIRSEGGKGAAVYFHLAAAR